jgi:TP901 family phage tail tape measure protein
MADISLLFDVAMTGDESTNSEALIKRQLTEIVSRINNEPFSIKVQVDSTSLDTIRKQISDITQAVNSKATTPTTNVSQVTTSSKPAITDIQRQQAEKSYLSTIIQIDRAIQNWTAAERSKNAETRKSYTNLKAVSEALKDTHQEYLTSGRKDDYFNKLTKNTQDAQVTLKETEIQLKSTGDATKSLSDRVGGLAEKFSTWFGISRVVMAIFRAMKQMVSAVIEVDTAMTELKKVTNETDATYDRFLNNAASRAKQLGATISDIVTASADFARLGFNLGEAEKLADAATVYKNVGDGITDINTASESIIATMQAFGVEATDVMSIVDKFNNIGNNFAISSKGVGDALLRSASAMHAANNTLDETIALATAANTVVQDPEKVGTTLKTVSMFLRAAKTDAEAAGESTEGMANSISELREEILALTGGAVDIQIDENTYKSTYQILQELSNVYDKLTDVSQANLLELLGGKRNSNVVAALLENFTVAEEALATSADSAGSAMAENEKYLDSINGKISILKASFEELSTNFIDSQFIKDIVEAGTNLLNVLNSVGEVIEKIGGLSNILTVVTPVVALLNAGKITEFMSSVKGFQILKDAFNSLSPTLNNASGYLAQFIYGVADGYGVINSFKGTVKELWSTMSAFSKLSWIIIAISAAVKIIDWLVVTTEEANEKLAESKAEYQSITNELKSLNDELQTTNDRIAELQNKGTLSFTEQEELTLLQQESAELERQIQLLTIKQQTAQKQQYTDFLKAGRTFQYGASQWGATGAGGFGFISDSTKLTQLYMDYEGNMQRYNNAVANGDVEKATKYYERASKNMLSASEIVGEAVTAIEGISYIYKENLTPEEEEINRTLDFYNDIIDKYQIIAGIAGSKESSLDRLTTQTFAEDVSDLVNDEEVTVEELQVDKYDEFIDKCIELGIISDDSATSLAFLASYFNETGDAAEKAANQVTQVSDAVSTLSGIQSMEAGLDQLDKIYADIYNKEDFDWGSILNNKEFEETFGKFTDEYNDFITTVANSPNDLKACQTVFNNLATAYLSTCNELKNVTDETRNATIAFLEQKGIANAVAIVDNQLAINKAKLRLESEGVTASSINEAVAMAEACEASEAERMALAQLLIEKIRTNQITIDTSGDVENLLRLAEMAGVATGSIANLIKAKELLAMAERIEADKSIPVFGVSGDSTVRDASIAALRAQAEKLQSQPIEFEVKTNATYTGGSATNAAKDAAAKKQKSEKTWFDKQLAEHKHLVAMEKETQKEYLDWLDSAYKKAYKEGKIDLEDYYKYEEEVFNGRKDLFKDHLNDTEHKIEVLSRTSGNTEEIKQLYENLIGDIEVELFKARERGLDETDDYYQELMDKQQGYYDEMEGLFEDHISDTEHKISILEEYESQEEEVVKLTEGMLKDIEAELADARARGLDENDEYIQKLEKQWQDCYDDLHDMFKDHLNDIDHEISMRENYDGETQNIIKLHEQAKLDIEKQIADLRAKGYTDNDDKIQDLQSEWISHDNAIRELQEDALKDAKDAVDELVDYKVQMLKQEIQDEKEALNKKLDNLREFYDKQKEMLQDQYDEEKYLEEQSEKRKTVSDIEAELAMLEHDDSAWAQKRKLELKEELIAAQKELDDFEEDKALDLALEAIDDAAEAQTKQLEAEMDALDERLNNPKALYNQALAEIVNNTGNLYAEMHAYNNKHGSGNPDDVDEKYDNAYEALGKYEDVYGESYNNIELPNSTNHQSDKGSWDETPISGTNPDNQVQAEPNLPPSTPAPVTKPMSSSEPDEDELFMRGSIVQVNPTTTHFSSKSNNKKMGSDVAGGVYTIMEIDGLEVKIGNNGKAVGWVRLADLTMLDSYGTSGVEYVVVPESSGSTSGSSGSSSNSSKPSLTKGSTITVKTTATHFGSKSGGGKMASFVPGGKYTVMNTSGDQVLIGVNGVATGWIKKSDIVGYASGSSHTKAGLARIFEDGYEQIFTSADGSKYKLFNNGDKVLNAKATEFLYNFAESGGAILNNILTRLLSGNMPNILGNNAKLMDIHLGDIIIQGNADNRTVSEIRRAQRDNIDYILTEFQKLNR